MAHETLGERVQRAMGENGALGHLSYAQHQALKAVTDEAQLRDFLVEVGFLEADRGSASPRAFERAMDVLEGRTDESEARAAAFLVILASS